MEIIKKQFKEIKSIKWENSTVSFYIIHRILIDRKAKYIVSFVETTENLRKKIRKLAVDKINLANQFQEYEFTTSDNDDDFLSIGVNETDFEQIEDALLQSQRNNKVKKQEDLSNAWMYVARFDIESNVLFSARKMPESWNVEKKKDVTNLIFERGILADLDEKGPVFKIDNKIDFFAYKDCLFILNKKAFEASMNFRTGMIRNRDDIVEEFKKINLFDDSDRFGTLIGDNTRRLRKLSQVKKSGYYKDTDFIKRTQSVSVKNKLPVKFTADNRFIAEDETVEFVLHLLDNDYVKSQNNNENFVVDVKIKVVI